MLNNNFPIQNNTEELQRLNSLLFNKIKNLKQKIIQLETELENNKHNSCYEFNDFEIIDLSIINDFNLGLYNV